MSHFGFWGAGPCFGLGWDGFGDDWEALQGEGGSSRDLDEIQLHLTAGNGGGGLKVLLAPEHGRTWGSGVVVERQKCGCVNKHIYPGNSRIWGGFQGLTVHLEVRSPSGWVLSAFFPQTHLDFASVQLQHSLGCCSQPSWVREPWQGDPGGSGWEICVVSAFPAALDSNPLWILTSSGLRCFLCLHLSTVLAWLGGGCWIFSSGEKTEGWSWMDVMEKQNEESPLAGEGKQELGRENKNWGISWAGKDDPVQLLTLFRPQNPKYSWSCGSLGNVPIAGEIPQTPKTSPDFHPKPQTQLPPPGSSSFFLVNIWTDLSNPDH